MSLLLLPSGVEAETITYSGTVSYDGVHMGDSLYVAVIDTTGVDDVDLLAIQSYAPGAPPFSVGYSLDFDNEEVGSSLIIASFLDVDGGGIEMLTGSDVFGWYAGTVTPTGVSSSGSQSGLDFDLPRAEIRGTVTFAPGQEWADIEFHTDASCLGNEFRPTLELTSSGEYEVQGLYAGTYCVRADGEAKQGSVEVCFGDPNCETPTLITLGDTDIQTGVDLDFSVVGTEKISWGGIKNRHP
ncbi:MAG: hypothetical protein HKN21_02185 [Candidatus Eisenbacteria bacterium]|uniref:Uncharacterized protein n=1 Tax=Eiseniibacteriota bacterium TaxID=2212470 RepID=A0A7Y2E711_UNCEI|nr:hypothetical protein [Candidatus Eisenbacteria bacterium]